MDFGLWILDLKKAAIALLSALAVFLLLAVAASRLPVVQAEEPAAAPQANTSTELSTSVEAGRVVYEKWCQYCHGAAGDANTPAAEDMLPRPRDFTFGLYKYRTTFSPEGESGLMPTDDNLARIIRQGMPGSTMPGWEGVLTEQEIQDVVTYLKTFAEAWFEVAPPGSQIPVGAAPEITLDILERGRSLYEGEVECFKCHGMAGRGDGESAPELEDDWGYFIRARNLTRNWTFRGGGTVEDIFLAITTGLVGTPMPSQIDALPDEADRWALAYYVRSLAPPEKPEVKAAVEATRFESELPASVDDPAWAQIEATYFPLTGQITTLSRNFNPMVTEVWVKALYNDDDIALLLTWDDPSEKQGSRGAGEQGSEEAIQNPVDAIAIQFPVKLSAGMQKPHFLMGDKRNPVNLWYWQADGQLEEQNAAGLETIQTQAAGSQELVGEVVYNHGQYRMVTRRARFTRDTENDIQFEAGQFIPISFTAWDGFSGEVGHKRAVSAWYFIFLKPVTPASRFLYVPLAVIIAIVAEGWVVRAIRKNK